MFQKPDNSSELHPTENLHANEKKIKTEFGGYKAKEKTGYVGSVDAK